MKKQKVAGPWMGSDGAYGEPCTRDDISGPEGILGATLAIVYPTCVYVRTFRGEEWRRVKNMAAADRVLRKNGWMLT